VGFVALGHSGGERGRRGCAAREEEKGPLDLVREQSSGRVIASRFESRLIQLLVPRTASEGQYSVHHEPGGDGQNHHRHEPQECVLIPDVWQCTERAYDQARPHENGREDGGHSVEALVKTFDNIPRNGGRPQVVIAHTVKGKGVKYMEDSRVWHLGYLHGSDAEDVRKEILAHDN